MSSPREPDRIINEVVGALEKSRDDINELCENTRTEQDAIINNLQKLKRQARDIIEHIDQLHVKEKQARLHLIEISKNYHNYKEDDIKQAYESAREIQINLGLMKEREKQVTFKRDELELKLKQMDETLERSEQMGSRLGVARDYMIGNLQGIGGKLEEFQQKQGFGLKIILAQEEERKRVAREIHDGPAQSMANLVLRTEICEKILDSKPLEVKEELNELKMMVRSSLNEIRKIIFDLRPMAIDDLGLIATLKRYLEDIRERHSLKIEFVSSGGPVWGNKDLEIAVFRIVQEALNNVLKHADATDVLVKIDVMNNHINVIVRDNGRGFKTEAKHPEGSFGLLGMRERIELLEGTMKISSAPGKGTEITVRIPIKKDKVKEAGR